MPDTYQDHLRTARTALATARQMIGAEISTYPTPISGCDAQFNHLLGERQKVREALRSLEGEVFVPTPRSPTPTTGVESR